MRSLLKLFLSTLKTITKRQYFLILIIFFCIYTIVNNTLVAFEFFYQAYKLKKQIILSFEHLDVTLLFSKIFTEELEEFYLMNELLNFIKNITWKIIFGILMIIPILLIIAYSTLLERKVLSASQKRRGPNKVGVKGSAQPLIDGVKLILKEIIIPVQSENKIFILSSIWSIFFMLLLWFVIPTSKHGNIIQFNYELLALFCISVLGSISILLAGWSSNSKYAFLGGI